MKARSSKLQSRINTVLTKTSEFLKTEKYCIFPKFKQHLMLSNSHNNYLIKKFNVYIKTFQGCYWICLIIFSEEPTPILFLYLSMTAISTNQFCFTLLFCEDRSRIDRYQIKPMVCIVCYQQPFVFAFLVCVFIKCQSLYFLLFL